MLLLSEQLQKLTNGSFEHLISRLGEKVQEDASKLFGEEVQTSVIGTFPGHAIVAGDNGKVLRLRFEESNEGDLIVTGHDNIDVPVYSEDNRSGYVSEASKTLVRSLLEGKDPADAFSALTSAVSVNGPSAEVEVLQVLESEDSLFPKLWKTVFDLNQVTIKRSLWDSGLKDLEEKKVVPRFTELHESADDSRREVVLADLRGLVNRLVERRMAIPGTLSTENCPELGSVSVADFAHVLREGLVNAENFVSRALVLAEDGMGTNVLARVHDYVAAHLFPLEVSTLFVQSTERKAA